MYLTAENDFVLVLPELGFVNQKSYVWYKEVSSSKSSFSHHVSVSKSIKNLKLDQKESSILIFNREKFSRGSRSYLVVTCTVCEKARTTTKSSKWLQKFQKLKMGSKCSNGNKSSNDNKSSNGNKCSNGNKSSNGIKSSNGNKKLPILVVT